MTALSLDPVVHPPRPDPVSLVSQLTRLALTSSCKAEFRGRTLALLASVLQFDRACWEEVPPFGEFRVEYPGEPLGQADPRLGGAARVKVSAPGPAPAGQSAMDGIAGSLRLDLERFGRRRAVLLLEREEGAFGARELEWLRTLLPMLILADEGTAGTALPTPTTALTAREQEIVEYVRLGYTNAQIALATGRSVAAVRNLLVRIFDKTGVRTRAQLVRGALATGGLTRREREIVVHLRSGLTNREIGVMLGISSNTVRNTLARLFEKLGVSTRSELVGALASEELEAPGAPTTW